MNAAFSIWEDRIAPVFDTASRLAVVTGTRTEGPPHVVTMRWTSPVEVIAILLERHVSVLVCGAISRPLHDAIVDRNIEVHPFVTGELDDVVRAWRTGRLHEDRFRMPGCGRANGVRGRRTRRRGDRRDNVHAPFGASAVAGGQAVCRCPRCGREVFHTPGVPCSANRCPDCHAPLVRA
ncbi:NifB/NifX family molybdenum-iron cluster-binding protein [Pseudodesulfovibrio portus]|uniref:Dinitrogenase iron-molybdenum cofactor biosynthesis domain-containing protein n=1 Tax=Pseudodesulfovibrio portus TaxID=231439 RepID=A0ABM8AVL4_9BACT|nr:hypothetical protein [Pseudodesulfovibrio portus]BDQ35527.1 hypothetical protein JCM14722_30690 [Pseudodesulfovibrio portus]